MNKTNIKQNEFNSDDFNTMERSFLKMKINMGKDGYRDGIEEGRKHVFQKYFDQGYVDGFKNGYTLGRLKGTQCAKSVFCKANGSQTGVLEKSSTGACVLCKDGEQLSNRVADIRNHQNEVLNNLTTSIDEVTN